MGFNWAYVPKACADIDEEDDDTLGNGVDLEDVLGAPR